MADTPEFRRQSLTKTLETARISPDTVPVLAERVASANVGGIRRNRLHVTVE